MTSRKSLIIIMLMLLGLATLSAWSVTDTYFGNKFGSIDARSYAMGGSGVMDAMRPFGLSINPASLTQMEATFGLQGSLFINRNEDNRDLPMYNSFDNYIDDAVYASNINFYDDYAGAGFAAYGINNLRLGVGGYYKPLLSFDGIYDEEIRNNRNTDSDGYPEKIAVNGILNTGMLNQASGVISLGYKTENGMSFDIGIDYAMLNGSIKNEKTIRWTQWAIDKIAPDSLPDYTRIEKIDLEGSQLKAGTMLRINKMIGLGLTYTAKATLDRSGSIVVHKGGYRNHEATLDTTKVSEDYILPTEIRLGMNYQPRNIMRTWFNLDVEYVKWKDVAANYENVFNFYAGVEHQVTNRLPLRLGFQAVHNFFRSGEILEGDWDNDPETDDTQIVVYTPTKYISPMITAGTSVALSKSFTVDLGFGYSWREYEALDMFMDSYYNDKTYTGSSTYRLWPNQYINLQDRGWENPDKVRENNISCNASLSFTW